MVQRRAAGAPGMEAGGAADGNGVGGERRPGAPRREGVQILGEAVAHVHHRAYFAAPGQPCALGQPRREPPVAAEPAAAERAGDVDPVTGPCAGARHDPRAGRLANEREKRAQKTVALRHVAADDGHGEAPRRGREPAIKLLQPARADARIKGQGDDRGGRPGAHGREVAEVALQQHFTGGARCHRVIEMAAVNHGIGRDQLPAGIGREHGAVVADAERRGRRDVAQPAADALDQPRFTERGDRIREVFGERVHRIVKVRVKVRVKVKVRGKVDYCPIPLKTSSSVCRLKRAWASIGTRMLPVRS